MQFPWGAPDMARIRTVKPELFKHEDLYELEQETALPVRLSFIGLFCVADRKGRFKWRPRQLKLDVLPYDLIDFGEVLEALAKGGFVQKYEANGETFGVITNFEKHQVINKREAQSALPPPPDQEQHDTAPETPITAPEQPDNTPEQQGNSHARNDASQEKHVHARASTCNARGEKEGKGKELEGKYTSAHSGELGLHEKTSTEDHDDDDDQEPQNGKTPYSPDFEAVWKVYPSRLGGNPKKRAWKAWCARLREGKTVEAMQAGAVRYAKFCRGTGKLNTEYVMQAATFFGPDCHFEESWDTSGGPPALAVGVLGGMTAGQAWLAARQQRGQA